MFHLPVCKMSKNMDRYLFLPFPIFWRCGRQGLFLLINSELFNCEKCLEHQRSIHIAWQLSTCCLVGMTFNSSRSRLQTCCDSRFLKGAKLPNWFLESTDRSCGLLRPRFVPFKLWQENCVDEVAEQISWGKRYFILSLQSREASGRLLFQVPGAHRRNWNCSYPGQAVSISFYQFSNFL